MPAAPDKERFGVGVPGEGRGHLLGHVRGEVGWQGGVPITVGKDARLSASHVPGDRLDDQVGALFVLMRYANRHSLLPFARENVSESQQRGNSQKDGNGQEARSTKRQASDPVGFHRLISRSR